MGVGGVYSNFKFEWKKRGKRDGDALTCFMVQVHNSISSIEVFVLQEEIRL